MLPPHVQEQIQIYSYLVKRGKPAASFPLQSRYVDDACKLVSGQNIQYYSEALAEGWVTLWMYKHSHVLDIIRQAPQAPKTIFDHWILGKLYGYDEESIHEFLTKHE